MRQRMRVVGLVRGARMIFLALSAVACSDPFSSAGAAAGAGSDAGPLDAGVGSDGIVDQSCTPRTCQQQEAACGPVDDGCGHSLDCGACRSFGDVCSKGICGCTKITCDDVPQSTCGAVSDGCGGLIACHTCGSGLTCGPASTCISTSCQTGAFAAGACGTVPDGCGGEHEAPNGCTAPETCSGGSEPFVCGCTALTCAAQGAFCGSGVDDGCGGTLSCGGCASPPGACGPEHTCTSCTRVGESDLGFEQACGKTGHPHAWACACDAAAGSCVVPDGASAAAPSCALLQKTTTGQHGVYCCDEDT